MKRYTSRVAVAALVFAGSVAATAQDVQQGQAVPAAQAATQGQPEEIVITGSRIKRTDLVAESPVSFVDADEIAKTASVNAEEVVRELPQAFPGISSGTNNGNPGAATVNLRGLDDERTLVLVNGRRFVGYDSEGIVDINNIPTPLIERVDVVTGGASAVYGSDAIAGVVNFILKDDFEGVQFDYDYANALRGGEATNSFSATVGVNAPEERGNLTLYASWTDRDAVSMANRAFSETAIDPSDGSHGGSSTDTNGNIICGGCFYNGSLGGAAFGPQDYVGFSGANADLIPRGSRRFNYEPFNYLQVPQIRYQATALGHYDLAEWATFYGEVHFSQTEIDSVIAPSGTFFNTFNIPFDSIYLTPQARSVLFDVNQDGVFNDDPDLDGDIDGDQVTDVAAFALGRRTIEVGPRITRNRTQAWQIVGGFKGDVPGLDGWSYDFSAQRGRTELSRIFQNDISGLRAQDLLDASSVSAFDLDDDGLINGSQTPVDGGPCLSTASRSGCALGSLFGDNSLNSAAASYMSLQLNEEVYTTQDVVHFDVGGDFGESFKIPGASPIGASFGAEWRRVRSESFPDDCYINPDCSIGFGSTTPVRGHITVKEVFGEVRVPILEDLPFAKSLTIGGAYRWADYSHSGTAAAWKVDGEYSPIEDLRLRAAYQRAVRAPNVYETFQPVTPELDNSNGDPCAAYHESNPGATVDTATRDLCVATGVPAARFTETAPGSGIWNTSVPDVIAGQINSFGGGNQNLKEEEAKTLTIGGVYQPSWLEGFNFSIDWYRVEIDDAISNIDSDVILQGCYVGGVTSMCPFVLRNPATGALVGDPSYGLLETEQNIAFIKVEGIDFAADYVLDLGNYGNVDLSFVASRLSQNDDKPAPGVPINVCKGKFGTVCDSPSASVRFTQRADWYVGDFNVGYRWRYIRGTDYEVPGALDPRFQHLEDVHYVDFVFGWTPSGIDMLQGFEFQVGLENAFDQDPPLSGEDIGPTDQNSGNTWPGTFDTLGRTLTVRATKKF